MEGVLSQVPYNSLRYNITELEFNQDHVGVAKRAALEAMTLYKNDKATLPLSAASIKNCAMPCTTIDVLSYTATQLRGV